MTDDRSPSPMNMPRTMDANALSVDDSSVPKVPEVFRSFTAMNVPSQELWDTTLANMRPAHTNGFDHIVGHPDPLMASPLWVRIAAEDDAEWLEQVRNVRGLRYIPLCSDPECVTPEHLCLIVPDSAPLPKGSLPALHAKDCCVTGGMKKSSARRKGKYRKYGEPRSGSATEKATNTATATDTRHTTENRTGGPTGSKPGSRCSCKSCCAGRKYYLSRGVWGAERINRVLDCVDVAEYRTNLHERVPQDLRSTCMYAKIPYLSEAAAKKSFTLATHQGRWVRAYRCSDPSCGAMHTTSKAKKSRRG